MKIRIILLGILTFIVYVSFAQRSCGGLPKTFQKEYIDLFDNNRDKQNNDSEDKHLIKIEIEAKHEKELDKSFRDECKTCNLPHYGKEVSIAIDFFDHAKLKILDDGGKLWLLKLETKDWQGFQFIFDDFYLPEGVELFLYNEKKDMQLGAFTYQNNRPDGRFVTQPLLGNNVFLEYYQPSDVTGQAILDIGSVVCIFNNYFLKKGPFSNEGSGSCQINTTCIEAFGWQNEIESVGMILEKDQANEYWGVCSGVLINKSNGYDGTDKPIFLTANHCYEHDGQTSTLSDWVFLFRHEAFSCIDDGNSQTKDLTRSIVGANILSRDVGSNISDYLLLELNCTIDEISDYDICFAGWSRNDYDAYTAESVTIHHPKGDLKKYSSSTIQPVSEDGVSLGGTDTMWKIIWTSGVTEPGSSGAPLFNANHQIIGQLAEGSSSCINPYGGDHFGKFSLSFYHGQFQNYLGSSSTADRLKPAIPDLNITISTNPTNVTPGSNVTFSASSTNSFGNLHCYWIVNTEEGDLEVLCDASSDSNCSASNTNPTQSYYFGSQGNYRIVLWATDDAGKQAYKEFVLNVSDHVNACIDINFWGKNDCENTRVFSLGSNLQLSDYAFAEFCRIYSGGPLLYDGIKTIKWYYDGNLTNTYSFNKTTNCFVDDNCYTPGYSPGCFSLNSSGEHIIKLEAYAGQLNSGTFVQVSPPSSISKNIYVVNCNGTSEISTQSVLNGYNGYVVDGIINLNPLSGLSIVVNSGSDLTIHAYNKAVIKPGVSFISGSNCIIKAFDCPSQDCGCSTLKNARVNNESITKLNQTLFIDEINVYPNPADNYVIIELGNLYEEVLKIELFDSSGKILFSQDCDIGTVNYVPINNMIHGTYFVRVQTKDAQAVRKLIKN